MNISHRFLAFFTTLAAIASTAQAASADSFPTVTHETTVQEGPLTKTETVFDRSANPLDHFTLHHVYSRHRARGAILFFPPLSFDFDFYQMSDTGEWADSLVAFLAREGYDVYGYSPGTRGLAVGSCEAGLFDCSVMAAWGLHSIVEDARVIRREIGHAHGSPIVAGVSFGAMTAIAVLNDAPGEFGGAALWEGALFSNDQAVRTLSQTWCALDEQNPNIFDDTLNPLVKFIVASARSAPNVPTAIPGYPAGTTNFDAYVQFLSSPPPSPATEPVPGLQFAVGNAAGTELLFADNTRAFNAIATLNDYLPNAGARDMNCSLAGDRTFTSNLGAFTGPIYAAGAGHGFGTRMLDNLGLFGSPDIVFTLTSKIGHEEHFMDKQHHELLERPFSEWLADHFR